MSILKVAVLTGGASLERDISLKAGEACLDALTALGHSAHLIDVDRNLGTDLAKMSPDVAFNALHGRWGEDGCVQGLLELMRIPYTHSGVLASALAMDKHTSKLAYAQAGVPSPESLLLPVEQIRKAHQMPRPYIVKPHNEGSSLGGFYLVKADDPPPRITQTDREMFLVERFIPGRELTVTVLGETAIAVSEFDIGAWYDFTSKYTLSEANRILPADIPEDIYARCLDLAERCHKALGCRSLSRTDFRWGESRGQDGIFALETNTQPGLRPNSNAGQQIAHAGMSFSELCRFLLEDASLDR